ncbi:cysteine protease ATG4A-like isoform X2 [Watersipora subatra]|uniref:cysteine protease ATG4A-like isoform X2 n=1 Tax=Watersipora subatra TaxID=2589382 RepID=UPI00355BABC0
MDEFAFAAVGLPYNTYESAVGQEDFPKSDEPVTILGRQYSTIYDYADLKKDILTRPWITYRKGYSNIGGTGPTTDQGWGCMLRCGQMMLCQSLLNLHLPQEWRWSRDSLGGNIKYRRILEMFVDTKRACYSIHQIASMGVAEGKDVGQWFGPNTIAHVLKKLTSYDDWNRLVIHVAMDNTVVIDDIKTLCRTPHTSSGVNLQFEADPCSSSKAGDNLPPLSSPNTSFIGESSTWRPLLLMVPLRLGIASFNDVYLPSLKRCFQMPYSVGMLGGKPNHAHWFIGYVGNELVFLDPHTTQPVVDLKPDGLWDDSSYHCSIAGRMKISNLDPSLAMGFFCKTEAELDDLAKMLNNERRSSTPMFEVCLRRPSHLPPPHTGNPHGTDAVFTVVPSPKYDTDEEYELV